MKKISFILPLFNNDGSTQKRENFDAIETALIAIVGGFTSFETVGKWCDNQGKVYADKGVMYFSTIENDDTYNAVLDLLQLAATLFDQSCIYCDVVECSVFFVGRQFSANVA